MRAVVSKPKVTRDSALFAGGLVGVGWQTFMESADRPTLLLLFGAMMGLPAFLRLDERAAEKAKTVTPAPPVAPEPAPVDAA